MTRSRLTDRVQLTADSSPRTAKIDRFIVHHAATTSLSAILSLFQPGGRTVSANYALGSDGTLVNTVDEDRRAWTSASASWDGRAVTIEVANSYAGDPWPVSAAAFDKLARLIADVSSRYGFPINDDTILTHQELYRRFQVSYATACPGDLQRRKPELLALANKYRAAGAAAGGPGAPIEEEDMFKPYPFWEDYRTGKEGSPGIDLSPNDMQFLSLDADNTRDLCAIADSGPLVMITAHLYAKADIPGERLDLCVVRYNPTTRESSPHFTERAVSDGEGVIMANPTFQMPKVAGWRYYLRVHSPSRNNTRVYVTRLAADAALHA